MKTFSEFTSVVKTELENHLPTDFRGAIKLDPITKNNGVVKTGLTIYRPGETVQPMLYLEPFYQDYTDGKELPDILKEIAVTYVESIHRGDVLGNINPTSFDSVKDRITCRLVSQKENTVFLRQAPHRQMEDLAEIYQISIMESKDGEGSIKVNNALMRQWNISPEELHTLALRNTERMYPPTFQTIEQVIISMMTGEERSGNLLQDNRNFQPDLMYVLTNKTNMHGAAVLLYPDVLERVRQVIGSDYYVLPSSVHEVLVIPKDGIHQKQELGKMVREVNATQVLPEERLSNCIYEYQSEKKTFKQVKESLPKRNEVRR